MDSKIYDLYFNQHMKICDISAIVGMTRQTVSNYLKQHSKFLEEKELRKAQSKKERRYKKMIWARDSRAEAAILKREHEMAVAELSAEKYH